VHLMSLVAVVAVPPGLMIAALGLDAWERALLGPAEPGRRPGRHRTESVASPLSDADTVPLPLVPRG
jgi:hypothetical protein